MPEGNLFNKLKVVMLPLCPGGQFVVQIKSSILTSDVLLLVQMLLDRAH